MGISIGSDYLVQFTSVKDQKVKPPAALSGATCTFDATLVEGEVSLATTVAMPEVGTDGDYYGIFTDTLTAARSTGDEVRFDMTCTDGAGTVRKKSFTDKVLG